MQTLTRELRRSLEKTIKEARHVAETGARKVIQQLAVDNHEPWSSMTPEQIALRNALRAHGRQLGDRRDERRRVQTIERLTTECAYEHWHRMLFARFLADTNLLIEPESGMESRWRIAGSWRVNGARIGWSWPARSRNACCLRSSVLAIRC